MRDEDSKDARFGQDVSGRKVLLVVEDDPITCEAVACVLTNEHYEVVTVDTGEKGLTLIQQQTFEGLYTDINLGDQVTGWQVGRAFDERWSAKPIVFASAAEWPNFNLPTMSVFLRKPFLLRRVVAELFISRNGSRALFTTCVQERGRAIPFFASPFAHLLQPGTS